MGKSAVTSWQHTRRRSASADASRWPSASRRAMAACSASPLRCAASTVSLSCWSRWCARPHWLRMCTEKMPSAPSSLAHRTVHAAGEASSPPGTSPPRPARLPAARCEALWRPLPSPSPLPAPSHRATQRGRAETSTSSARAALCPHEKAGTPIGPTPELPYMQREVWRSAMPTAQPWHASRSDAGRPCTSAREKTQPSPPQLEVTSRT
mmetsp:Transcript_38483/g.125170  ORF Transcript_38483/g.125170 Transcript_38483/m.125170 type:complete len:209 (-) Transcript_38483:617-1243(-)